VVITPGGLTAIFSSQDLVNKYRKQQQVCKNKKSPRTADLCYCFYHNFQLQIELRVQNASELAYQRLDHHYWSVHKWVSQHHIGHWAQRMLLFSAIMQYFSPTTFNFSSSITNASLANVIDDHDLYGFVFHDTDSRVTSHEETIFRLGLMAALRTKRHSFINLVYSTPLMNQFVFSDDLKLSVKQNVPYFVKRVSFTRPFGIFSTYSGDTQPFRVAAYKMFNLTSLTERCAPRRVVLLRREDRKILNTSKIALYLKEKFNKTLEYVTITGRNTSRAQIETFSSFGLMISSHSSQLVNMVFSHPSSVIIEVAPEFYNADFGEYAHGMGLRFQYAIGGAVPGAVIDKAERVCASQLSKCLGDSHCFLHQRFTCTGGRKICCKNRDFNANIPAVQIAIDNAIEHLNFRCQGKW